MSMKTSINLPSFFVLLASCCWFCSCKSTSVASDVTDGSLTGAVTIDGTTGSPDSNSEGVSVALDGTNFTTQTDSTGFWRIDNIKGGNYDVVVSKAGYGICRFYGITVEGPGIAHIDPMTLGVAPTDTPILSRASVTNGGTMLSIKAGSSVPYVFIDKASNTQPGDAHFLSELCSGGLGREAANDTGSSFSFSVESIHQAGIRSGDTIYVSACDANGYSNWRNWFPECLGTYFDPVDNVNRLISPGPRSNVLTVIIP